MNELTQKKRPYRVIITSDIHHIHNKTWYSYSSHDRMLLWAESIRREHERAPIDLIIIAGDVSLDHYIDKGSYTAEGISDTDEFVKKYIPLLPEGIPVFIGPGNHELYNNEQWRGYTGNDRQGHMVLDEDLFIFLDTYADQLEPNFRGDIDAYVLVDTEYIKGLMDKYPSHRVWLVSHYFDCKKESEAFKEIVRDPRVIGLFAGHIHKCDLIHMGEEYGNKVIAQTGNFSYSFYTAYPTGNIQDVYDSFWGFRELVIYDDSAISNYIIADSDVATISGEVRKFERRYIHSVEYKY